jgi:putative alpha-1,2-mannosidase
MKAGGTLEFVMGNKPNYKWGTDKSSVPPASAFE